jgi:hypothetical protein
MTIVTIHKHNADQLIKVKKEASEIGSVTINAYTDGETIFCLEGVHRVQAAYELKLPVSFILHEWKTVLETDIEDVGYEATVEEIFEYAYSRGCKGNIYDKSDFISVECTN